MSEKTIKEVLQGMDPERSIYLQNVANLIKEDALRDARSLSKKYFRDGFIVGVVLTSAVFGVLYYFGVI